MDYYETQKKYRNKRLKYLGSLAIKFVFIILTLIVGWRFGASDNDFLILENERISKSFENVKNDLEKKLISTRMQLKEANIALEAKNIREGFDYGIESKKLLSIALAKGIPEKRIIDHLRILTNNRICQKKENKELYVSTENFIPPNSTITLLGGNLRLKAQGLTKNKTIDKPFFDPEKPLSVTLMYFGGNEVLEEKLPIQTAILANKFSVVLNIVKSNLRGSVIIKYKVCKV